MLRQACTADMEPERAACGLASNATLHRTLLEASSCLIQRSDAGASAQQVDAAAVALAPLVPGPAWSEEAAPVNLQLVTR